MYTIRQNMVEPAQSTVFHEYHKWKDWFQSKWNFPWRETNAMASRFQGKVVLITGASSGIGYAIAQQLAAGGAKLGLLARREMRLQSLMQTLDSQTEAIPLVCDVSDDEACQRAVDELISRFGGIDLVINNAGVSMNGMFDDTDLSVFHQMMDVNYFGSLHIARHTGKHLEASKGSMMFITSVVGKRGFPTRSGYSASKFAVHALFETLRVEWATKDIHVGVVAPGYTDTEIRQKALGKNGKPRGRKGMTRGKVMTPVEAAQIIIRAAARRRREVILTPGGKLIVWINKIWGGLADRLAAHAIGGGLS